MNDRERIEYWNKDYAEYWKKVTEEAEEIGGADSKIKKLSGHDYKSPAIKVMTDFFDLLSFSAQDRLLDYGCGLGRFYPYFSDKCEYYGIDISSAMIDECLIKWPDKADRFIVSEGENLPFESLFFDKVICNGVFDACYQEQALEEMIRVCKIGGDILISGKNINYILDDNEAYIAEENARIKGHPNYFTNVENMISQLEGYCEISEERYALRRGDFGKGKFVYNRPNIFYEWELILHKQAEHNFSFEKFSSDYSETWIKKANT